jgi:hypothetical protein
MRIGVIRDYSENCQTIQISKKREIQKNSKNKLIKTQRFPQKSSPAHNPDHVEDL